jgi:AcrR family transcriptional regulator
MPHSEQSPGERSLGEPVRREPGRRGPYRKTAARQQDILDAALAVFGRSGYRAGSIREIAEVVGMSQAGLLHHFESKNALLTAVLRHRDEVSKLLYPKVASIQVLLATVEVVKFNMAHRGTVELYCVLSAEATAADHPAHLYFIDRYQWLRQVIGNSLQQMAECGQLQPGVEPTVAARSALALMDGLQVQWLLEPGSVDMAADLEAYFRRLTTDAAWETAVHSRAAASARSRVSASRPPWRRGNPSRTPATTARAWPGFRVARPRAPAGRPRRCRRSPQGAAAAAS